MTLAKYPLLLLFITGSVFAQQLSHPVILPTFSGSGRDDGFSAPRPYLTVPETVRILAVMVQFQEDADSRTTGNGRFDLSATSNPIIDPPPRNRQYFENHLTFVENYYRKASKGKTVTRATVIDQVFTLSGPMASYSPPKSGPNTAVGNIAVEAWGAVDASGLVPDFSPYDCFVVFHAGVGRDIDLVSILGYDPTPLDIPSLYLGINAFRSFYGQDYQGIPVNDGTFHITNSIIMPETESRLLPGISGDVLLELGINGLLVASVGNFLGLPDLFDTRTGRSGIGRFGLMDGQAIFSFSGLFPPEPSAWEKYWLGWIEPITLTAGEHTVVLPAVGVSDTVYRVPISAQEYYLVENRNRDPQRNGQTVTSIFNGVTETRTFLRDTSGFNAFNISALSGVVTDVEDLDWSLPGGVAGDGTFFDGGVLIWHIDEAAIADGLATNGVNADPLRRGVDVEEADGSQDIGQEYGFLTPGSGSEEGTPLDFWFDGNSSPVFTNTFGPTSYPNSYSNSGANSHITIKNISERGPVMTALVQVGSSTISPLFGFPKTVEKKLTRPSLTIGDITGDGAAEMILTTTDTAATTPRPPGAQLPVDVSSSIYAWNTSGAAALPGGPTSGLFAQVPAGISFASSPLVVGASVIAYGNGDSGGYLSGYSSTIVPSESLAHQWMERTFNGIRVTTLGAIDSILAVGTNKGKVNFYFLDGLPVATFSMGSDTTVEVRGISRYLGTDAFVLTGSSGVVYKSSLLLTGGGIDSTYVKLDVGRPIAGPAASGGFGPSNSDVRIVFTTTDGWLYALTPEMGPVAGFPVHVGEGVSNTVALADVDGDGYRDIVVFSRNRIHAFNRAGASLDYFPVAIPSPQPIASNPVVADVDGDGNVEVVAVTADGLVVAYDRTGRMAPGFPLQAGTGSQSVAVFDVPILSLSTIDIGLAVASSGTGSIVAWKTGSTRFPYDAARVRPWPQYQKDEQQSGLALEPLTGSPLSPRFFPADRAYNWPNPVYDGTTFIRYFVKDDATVNIKVFDLAGDLVTEFAGPGIGGVDNEVEWNVRDVQSGVYFARIEANGSAGGGVAIIKVAIVK